MRTYLSDEIQSLEVNLRNASASMDEKAVHDFRVSLKKLRAGFNFLIKAGFFPESKVEPLNTLKPAFRSGGELRDLQVIHELIMSYEHLLNKHFIHFRLFITKEMLMEAEDFKVKSKEVLLILDNTDWNHNLHMINDNPKIRAAVKKVIGKTFRKAERILFKSDSDIHSYHKIRKLLKKARFIFEMNMAGDWNGLDYHVHLNGLKKLEALLGGWHDRVSLLKKIEGFSGNETVISEDYSVLRSQVEKDITENLLSFDALFMNEFYWFYQFAVGVK